MELWDLYAADGKKTGETMVRGDAVPEGRYHLVVHVCIFNSKGEMLIQHRQPFKSGWSNLWDVTVGGSAVAGDSSQSAAEREVMEEIGHSLNLQNVRPTLTLHANDAINDIYLIQEDVDLASLHLQYEEVQAVKWASLEEIHSMIENGTFIPYLPSFIDLLFFLRDRRDTRTRADQ